MLQPFLEVFAGLTLYQLLKGCLLYTSSLLSPLDCLPAKAGGDRQILAKQLGISPHQLSYVTHSSEGEGLDVYKRQLIERQTCEHFVEWLEHREMAQKAA